MRTDHDASGTLDPGLLVRRVHGELQPGEAAEVDRHIATCARCRNLHGALARGEERLGALLRRTDAPLPEEGRWDRLRSDLRRAGPEGGTGSHRWPTGARARGLAAAGLVVALVATAAAASEPVRSWLARSWASVRGSQEVLLVDDTPAAQGSAAVDFRPGGPDLTVEVGTRHPRSLLEISFTDGGRASVAITGGGDDRLSVAAGVIRITDGTELPATYHLVVPLPVRRVSVRLDGRESIEIARQEGAGTVVVDLEEGRVVRNDGNRDEP